MHADVHITLSQGATSAAEDVLFRSGQASAPTDTISTTRQLNTDGNIITAAFTASPAFSAQFAPERHLGIALTGAVASLLMGSITWLLITRRDKAMAMAQSMTQELQSSQSQLKSVLRSEERRVG